MALQMPEFLQAIEQGVGNATWVKTSCKAMWLLLLALLVGCWISPDDSTGILEREKNIIADLQSLWKTANIPLLEVENIQMQTARKEALISAGCQEDLIAAIKSVTTHFGVAGAYLPPTAFGELCKSSSLSKSVMSRSLGRRANPCQFQIKT